MTDTVQVVQLILGGMAALGGLGAVIYFYIKGRSDQSHKQEKAAFEASKKDEKIDASPDLGPGSVRDKLRSGDF